MDINCTDKCRYQSDGKCTLTEVKAFNAAIAGKSNSFESDCPYFSKDALPTHFY